MSYYNKVILVGTVHSLHIPSSRITIQVHRKTPRYNRSMLIEVVDGYTHEISVGDPVLVEGELAHEDGVGFVVHAETVRSLPKSGNKPK